MQLAFQDIQQAIKKYQIWCELGLQEVKQRYRRSVLGPWWITISMSIFILAMGKIFSRIFVQNMSEYVPYFTASFLIWSFISNGINEAVDIFKSNHGFIKHVKLPYNLYMLKFFTKNLIVLAHNFVVYFFVMSFFKLNPYPAVILFIPGMILLLINMYWICLLVALISTRFRDMVPIVNTGLQILFFITPISWSSKLLGEHSIFLKFNPFVYLLDVVRQPLLGILPSFLTFWVTSVMALIGLAIALKVFSRVRSQIPFWID